MLDTKSVMKKCDDASITFETTLEKRKVQSSI